MIERQLWRCPRCGRSWHIPLGHNPDACPKCAPESAESDAGAADFEKYLSRLGQDDGVQAKRLKAPSKKRLSRVRPTKIRLDASEESGASELLNQLRGWASWATSLTLSQVQRLGRQRQTTGARISDSSVERPPAPIPPRLPPPLPTLNAPVTKEPPASEAGSAKPEPSDAIRDKQLANQRHRGLSSRGFVLAALILLTVICLYRADDVAKAFVGLGDSFQKLISSAPPNVPAATVRQANIQPPAESPPFEDDHRGDHRVAPSESTALIFNGFLVFIVIIVVFSLLVYLLPTFIAVGRGHPNAAAIAIINILLGWTAVGYAVALAWSVTNFQRQIAVTVNYPAPPGPPGPPPPRP